ncbi:N-acetyltransferase [Shimia sp. CNT1-13L.2]|uniref:GNAT family N-acetyltransferase n=1 Tax=Shimia sp. CNT1-13L.2 TaxID=2959663 RepID=UPI0020CF13E2|nr:N-acetyltransferase [Shimia sp. CNT1-13L.2]MCP9483769.1 N-acetyltransferase [Shimia sp. CNT1-13L.2]
MHQQDIDAIKDVHLKAFGPDEGPDIAALASALLARQDTILISAKRAGKIVGNVLFTPFIFQDQPEIQCHLLAPCGVMPDHQGQGVGKELMETSIDHLRTIGTQAVFVLGVPTFYPRYGYAPTDKQTPYPDLLTLPNSWMALELQRGTLAKLTGKTLAVAPIMPAVFWDTSVFD